MERAGPRSPRVEEAAEERVAERPRRPHRRDRGVEHGGRLRGEVAEPPLREVEGELVVAEGLPLPALGVDEVGSDGAEPQQRPPEPRTKRSGRPGLGGEAGREVVQRRPAGLGLFDPQMQLLDALLTHGFIATALQLRDRAVERTPMGARPRTQTALDERVGRTVRVGVRVGAEGDEPPLEQPDEVGDVAPALDPVEHPAQGLARTGEAEREAGGEGGGEPLPRVVGGRLLPQVDLGVEEGEIRVVGGVGHLHPVQAEPPLEHVADHGAHFGLRPHPPHEAVAGRRGRPRLLRRFIRSEVRPRTCRFWNLPIFGREAARPVAGLGRGGGRLEPRKREPDPVERPAPIRQRGDEPGVERGERRLVEGRVERTRSRPLPLGALGRQPDLVGAVEGPASGERGAVARHEPLQAPQALGVGGVARRPRAEGDRAEPGHP